MALILKIQEPPPSEGPSLLPIRTSGMSMFPYSTTMEALFTFEDNFGEIVKGAYKSPSSMTISVPREAVPYAAPPNDFRTSYPIHAIDCKFEPRYDQQKLCDQSIALLKQGKSHIFEASTGYGKTVCGVYIACQMGQPTVIVVQKSDLVTQWANSLKMMGIPADKIGHIQQDECNWQGKWFVTAMAQSLIIGGKYPKDMFDYFGMTIVDEVHKMPTECFVHACEMFSAKYRLGFSATPTRKDGRDKLLRWHIGPVLVKGTIIVMPPKILVKQTEWSIPSKRVWNEASQDFIYVPKIPYSPSRMGLVTKAMASSMSRNTEIVSFILQAYEANRNCLVLSELKEYHLNRLAEMLLGEGIPQKDIGFYVGGLSKIELELAKVKRIILGTYAMCSTGTDAILWDSLVLATPRSDVKQPIGRVMRANPGKKEPVILDLVDKNQIFQNFYISRLKQYYSVQAKIVKC